MTINGKTYQVGDLFTTSHSKVTEQSKRLFQTHLARCVSN